MPSTKPTLGETKLADSGSNPDGSGVPAGAVTGGIVVVGEVVVVDVVDVVVVVEVGEALFVDEVRLYVAAAIIITRAITPDVITIFCCLVMAFLHKLPYVHSIAGQSMRQEQFSRLRQISLLA
jgi:hypothetical protein